MTTRQPKYRFYDPFNGLMTYSDETKYRNCLSNFFFEYELLKNGGNDPILMECTGLKDDAQRDVYEGDIFRQELEHAEGDERNYLVVTWIRQRADFYLIPADHYGILNDNDLEEDPDFEWLFDDAKLLDFSIDIGLPLVGNIYQDPKLLKP